MGDAKAGQCEIAPHADIRNSRANMDHRVNLQNAKGTKAARIADSGDLPILFTVIWAPEPRILSIIACARDSASRMAGRNSINIQAQFVTKI